MKKLLYSLLLTTFFIVSIKANTLKVTNLTSGQISVTVKTAKQTISEVVPVNVNPILNDVNEPDPNPTSIKLDTTPVNKITIQRFSPNTPQIIYYEGQNTSDGNQKVGGIKALNSNARDSNMIVWNDYVEITNVAYSIKNLESFIFVANKIKQDLSTKNADKMQTKADDLSSSLDLIRNSDMGPELSIQIIAVQSIVDEILNNIKIIKTLNSTLQEIKNLQNNLAIGNNNLVGTNKAYKPSDNSVERSQDTLDSLQYSLQNITESNPTGVVADQVLVVKKAMNNLQDAINGMQYSRTAVNYQMLKPPENNLQTVQSIS